MRGLQEECSQQTLSYTTHLQQFCRRAACDSVSDKRLNGIVQVDKRSRQRVHDLHRRRFRSFHRESFHEQIDPLPPYAHVCIVRKWRESAMMLESRSHVPCTNLTCQLIFDLMQTVHINANVS